jgi:hypothetical protein
MHMDKRALIAAVVVLFSGTTAALAACEGATGRGWASGKGKGSYEMSSGDKSCTIPFVGFFANDGNDFTSANEVSLSKAPKSGKIGVSSKGIVYTPNAGFKGKDRFCTINRNSAATNKKLSGCYDVTVR